ncbi:MAG: hypothetical protein IT304_13185, partial [Dehalococcoidia bacterium]|nr:hypothetical protein [Dehalococcoidia bacterium]
MVVEPDANNSAISIKLIEAGKTVAVETMRLKPEIRKGWGAGVEEDLSRTAAAMPGWRERAFPVRVEADAQAIWFWFDGRAIASVPRTGAVTEVMFHTPGDASIRQATVTALTGRRGGFQPLNLDGYSNGVSAAAAPSGVTLVGGVPFEISSRPIDVSQAGLRLRKKPSGPGSLYQNPFNFISAMDGDPLTLLLRVPKRYYRRVWLLCAAVDGPGLSPNVTVRLARYRGDGGVFFSDATVRAPRLTDTASSRPSLPFANGRLWLVEVPVDSGAKQDILAADVLTKQGNPSAVLKLDADVPWIEIELTRELRADLNAMLPLGPRSGVQVYGVTLEESPVRMVASSAVNGHLFETGQAPRFKVWLENVTATAHKVTLQVDGRTRAIALAP